MRWDHANTRNHQIHDIVMISWRPIQFHECYNKFMMKVSSSWIGSWKISWYTSSISCYRNPRLSGCRTHQARDFPTIGSIKQSNTHYSGFISTNKQYSQIMIKIRLVFQWQLLARLVQQAEFGFTEQVLKWVSCTVTQLTNHTSKILSSLFLLIFLSKHMFVCIRPRTTRIRL